MSNKSLNIVICALCIVMIGGFIHQLYLTPEILKGGYLTKINIIAANNTKNEEKIKANESEIRSLEVRNKILLEYLGIEINKYNELIIVPRKDNQKKKGI